MKLPLITTFILFITLIMAQNSYSQTADVKIKDIPAAESTTIEINKKPSEQKLKFVITEGSDEIHADSATLLKDARSNWKKACEDWKKELKELNKVNQIISMSCGKMTCDSNTMETSCKSKTAYKIKVKEDKE